MRNMNIVFYDAGGGHRNAADAVKSAMEAQSYPWAVTLLNLQELLDRIDPVHRTTGMRIQDVYNLILRRGWTRFTPQLIPLLQGLIRLNHGRVVRVLQKYWAEHPSDLVLSVIPHFNRADRREHSQIPAGCAVRHDADGFRRLPATLLDRARVGIPDLRH